MSQLHQFIPSLLAGDAVGGHCLLVHRLLREQGVDSVIYAAAWAAEFDDICRPFESYTGGPALYQYAVGSGVGDFVAAHVTDLAVNSHNATPPRFFAGWDRPDVEVAAAWGERQLRVLAQPASLGVGVSAFNEIGLRHAGFASTAVCPLLFDPASFDRDGDPVTEGRLRSSAAGHDWLYVGRLVPNKCQHDLIRAFSVYLRSHPGGRLWLVGRTDIARYERAIRRLVDELGLAESVTLAGAVPAPVLTSYYRCADVFVSASEHEGFGVPFIEAMQHGLPVVAHRSSAVEETIGTGGLVVNDKSPDALAAAVESALTARARWREAGADRAATFALDRTGPALWSVLSTWLRERPECSQ